MLDCAYSLREVSLGDKFTFNGRDVSRACSLADPDGLRNHWSSATSSVDGKAYAADEVPNNIAAHRHRPTEKRSPEDSYQ